MRIVVWDLPTRVFHWLLACLAIGLLVTGKTGGEAMRWHAWFGYGVAALVLFRVAWGFVGGHWSRFASFPPSPARAWAYLRGRGERTAAGHNPLGAFSVYAMLLFFALQAASGLFSETKEDFAGPLVVLVSNDTVRFLTGYHKIVGEVVLEVLVALHLAAVAWYMFRGESLVKPMLTGSRDLPSSAPASADDARTRVRAVFVLSLCSLAVWGIVRLGG